MSWSHPRITRAVWRTLFFGPMFALTLGAPAGLAQEVAVRKDAQPPRLVRSDVSPPLRDMSLIAPRFESEEDEHPVGRWPHRHGRRALDLSDFSVLQTETGLLVSAQPRANFDGLGTSSSYRVETAPPDTVGAAGATQYVQWVNLAFAVYRKSDGLLIYGPANGNTLWQGFGGRCETDNSGDPIVMYDKAANRWVMTQFAISRAPYYQCVAVSTGSDATGSYRRFAYSFGNDMNDYGKGGVWPDGYYIAFNMYRNAQQFLGSKVCALDRSRMLTPNETPRPIQCFQLSTSHGGLLPSDLDGSTTPPAGAPNYHLSLEDVSGRALSLWKFHVDWVNPARSTFTGPVKAAVALFTEACGGLEWTCIPQPGTSQRLDAIGDRLMYRLAYRNFGTHESLVVNHSVQVNGVTGIRWYEIRNPEGTPEVAQQGTYAPDSTHRWMGSIAQDRDGNMLLGYTASSASIAPSARFTGRLESDPPNRMQQESEIHTGGGSQSAGLSRWGDYSAMTIDPVDDCTFWYTSEYLTFDGGYNWSTRIASFKFPSCGQQPGACTATVSADRWKGEYFANRTLSGQPSLTRDDGAAGLNFDWGTASPGSSCNVPADQFSVRWTRTVNFTAGRYRFTATTDDGVRLYVDNSLKIDKWVDRGPTTDLVDIDLTAGNHALRLEYYEATGGAVARLSFERIGDVPSTSIIVDDGPANASGVVEFLQTATGRPEWWYRETTVGYGNDMVWTTNTATRKDNYARWKPKLPQAGSYKVEAYVPSANATTERAQYVILASGASQTKTVNQNALANAWADLGTYNFRADGTEYVELGDVTGETSNSRRVGFDAMRFTPAATPPHSCQATVPANRWKGEYFNGPNLAGVPLMVRNDGDGSLNFDWGTGSPGASCGVPVDQFSARFARTAPFSGGNHRFTVTSDDGFRLYLDGVLKLDKWIVQAPATYTVDVSLTAGDHALRFEYFEAAGGAVAKLSWQGVTPPSSGAWAFPVGAETTGAPWRVTLGLGQSWTASGGRQYNGHLAEDWSRASGNLGQPVYAAAEGEVVTAVQNCGNYVDVIVLRHNEFVDGEQIYTMYGHIETTLQVGDRVRRRQQIGVLGDPVTFGPHLHFEVKTKTALLNLPFSGCANPSRSVYVSAGYSGRRGDYGGADSWDPTDSVRGNVYFHPTRFIRKRLPTAATLSSAAAEPLGPPAVPSAADGLPRCEPR